MWVEIRFYLSLMNWKQAMIGFSREKIYGKGGEPEKTHINSLHLTAPQFSSSWVQTGLNVLLMGY